MDLYQLIQKNSLAWSSAEKLWAERVLLAVSILMLMLMVCKVIRLSQAIAMIGITAYMMLVMHTTVFGRVPGVRQMELRLFWSYPEIMRGNQEILYEVLLNCVMLAPAGFLLPIAVKRVVRWYLSLPIGFVISAVIELLQLYTCRGLFEFDDIFHNGLGFMLACVAGSILVRLAKWLM